jgi:class 3 adenylate cyclase
MATVQRRLSVIVCADVVGYSRLMGSDELGTLTALKAHREAIDPLFAEEGGRLVKTTGDGLLLEFPSAFHAVRASLSVQRLMAERNGDVPEDRRLIFRMGIHLGDVIVDNDDIFGDGVNIAARLQEIADPGGICLSQSVHATIHKNIDALFRDGGNKVLKNIAAPIHVYNLALDGSTTSSPPRPATPAAPPLLSLIVLPFINLSGNARQDYVVDSVTDHLTSEMARIESSFVVVRATALSYRGDALDVTEIDRFDLALGEPFAMQHDIVARLIPPLHAHLLAASGRTPQPAPTLLPQARNGAPAGRGGNVVHPRGMAPPAARAVPPAASAGLAPPAPRPTSVPAPVVRVAPTPAAATPSPARPAQPARQRAPLRIPFWIKILVIVIAGAAALAMLGAERRSIVEIVSWMLIAAGAVQMVGALTAGPRPD